MRTVSQPVSFKIISLACSQLLNAVIAGEIADVKTQLTNGADVNAVDQHGNTLVMRATMMQDTDMVQLLCLQGADVNIRNTTKTPQGPIEFAINNGYHKILSILFTRPVTLRIGINEWPSGSKVVDELNMAMNIQGKQCPDSRGSTCAETAAKRNLWRAVAAIVLSGVHTTNQDALVAAKKLAHTKEAANVLQAWEKGQSRLVAPSYT
jgi:hypothetical protein